MSQVKLSKLTFKVDGLYTDGHARRCEAMIRNSAGGIEDVRANYTNGAVTITFDARRQTPHTIRDILDDTGYVVIG